MGFKDALYWKKLSDKKVKCVLCPHQCIMDNGEVGKCNVKMNIHGKLKAMNYGRPYEISYSKVESQGLYHFLPGKEIMKIIVPGENMESKYGKSIVFSDELPTLNQNPQKVLNQINKTNTGLVFYGGESLMSFEYVKDISEMNKKRNVFASKGFVEIEVLRDVAKMMECGVFEISSMREEFYEKILGGKLEPVLKVVKEFHDSEKWVEIKMPVIAEFHENLYDVRKLVSWILNNLNENVPLHFVSVNADSELIKKMRKIALDAGMNYVYTDDIDFGEGKTTFCPQCKRAVVVRNENVELFMKRGRCNCGFDIPGVWQ